MAQWQLDLRPAAPEAKVLAETVPQLAAMVCPVLWSSPNSARSDVEKVGVIALLLLHAPDGHEVRVNPSQITSLHSPKLTGNDGTLFAKGANCRVGLADGAFVAVVEPCLVVQNMLEKAK